MPNKSLAQPVADRCPAKDNSRVILTPSCTRSVKNTPAEFRKACSHAHLASQVPRSHFPDEVNVSELPYMYQEVWSTAFCQLSG